MDEGEYGGLSCHMLGKDRVTERESGAHEEGCRAKKGSPKVSTFYLESSKSGV